MDEIDQAQILNDEHLARSLASVQANVWAGSKPAPILSECKDCGEEIPEGRRSYMKKNNTPCTRCVACQTRYEKESRWRE